MVTFTVSQKAKDDPAQTLLNTIPVKDVFDILGQQKKIGWNIINQPHLVESYGCDVKEIVKIKNMHPFIAAAQESFDTHRPLTISPEHVWLLISQGVATHINLNYKILKNHFVQHEGKKLLEIRRDNFIKGDINNDWPNAFDEFSQHIKEYIGKKHGLFVPSFSTTTEVSKAANEIVLMGAMKNFFDYACSTLCGIPEITLEGTLEDWKSIRSRVEFFEEFNLDWWISKLIPVLDKIIHTFEGEIDLEFWNSFYKLGGGSGGPYVTGWINMLFPYSAINSKNTIFLHRNGNWESCVGYMGGGPSTNHFSRGMTFVPFKWKYYQTEYDMEFIAGFIGISQDDETKTLRPELGWAVRDTIPQDNPSK